MKISFIGKESWYLGVSFKVHEFFEDEPPLDIPELMLARCIIGVIFELRTVQVDEKRRKPTRTFEIALNKLKPYIFIY